MRSKQDSVRDLPSVTVVISTCNRGGTVITAIESILANDYPHFGLLVVDQSDTNATEDAVLRFHGDGRFRYIRSATRGLGAGHNVGISHATTELIAITDDDCVVPPCWLNEMVEAFSIDDRVALVFGNVHPAEYDVTLGYIPIFERDEPFLVKSAGDDLFRGLGIGACFGIKRSAWWAVHGFDAMLGPGAPLGSLEDRDMAIRLLLAGYRVYCTPRFYVIHDGFRTNRQLRGLAFRDWSGFGSSYAKYLKCGHWSLTRYMAGQMWAGQAARMSLSSSYRTGRIRRVTPVVSFWLGFLRGLICPVEPDSLKFKTRPSGAHRRTARLQTLRYRLTKAKLL